MVAEETLKGGVNAFVAQWNLVDELGIPYTYARRILGPFVKWPERENQRERVDVGAELFRVVGREKLRGRKEVIGDLYKGDALINGIKYV